MGNLYSFFKAKPKFFFISLFCFGLFSFPQISFAYSSTTSSYIEVGQSSFTNANSAVGKQGLNGSAGIAAKNALITLRAINFCLYTKEWTKLHPRVYNYGR